MPANLITFAHFSTAADRIVANSAGEPGHRAAQLFDPLPDLGVGEAGIELLVQEIDDVGRRVPGHADAGKTAGLDSRARNPPPLESLATRSVAWWSSPPEGQSWTDFFNGNPSRAD
jgi:hypothetical protein